MNPEPQSSSSSARRGGKIGEDGLTKHQCHYHKKKRRLAEEALDNESSGTPKNNELDDQRSAADILRILRDSRHPNAISQAFDCEEYSELDWFASIESGVVLWCSNWGGMSNWPEWLEFSYTKAARLGHLDSWYSNVWGHVDHGRQLQTRLLELYGFLPQEHYKIKELFRRAVELVHILTKGITLVEIRVKLIPDVYAINVTEGVQSEGEGSPLPPSDDALRLASSDDLGDYQ